jgi:hypothetical protein
LRPTLCGREQQSQSLLCCSYWSSCRLTLKIQAGRITEIQAGSCDFAGKVKYQNLTIAEKKLGPIQLLSVSTITKQEGSPTK